MQFKLAVSITEGIQDTHDGVLRNYHLVDPTYDFQAGEQLEVTSPQLLKMFLDYGRLDYKNFRASLAARVAQEGFANLSLVDKQLAARNFVVSKADRDSIFSLEEQVEHGAVFHADSILCREERYRRAASEVYNRLTGAESSLIVGTIITKGLDTLYKQYGIEGTPSGDVEGLYDFIAGTAGTTYSSGGLIPGLPHRSFTPAGMTIQELSDRIMAILRGEA